MFPKSSHSVVIKTHARKSLSSNKKFKSQLCIISVPYQKSNSKKIERKGNFLSLKSHFSPVLERTHTQFWCNMANFLSHLSVSQFLFLLFSYTVSVSCSATRVSGISSDICDVFSNDYSPNETHSIRYTHYSFIHIMYKQ